MKKGKKKKKVIGVDLGGTKMLAGLLGKNFDVSASIKVKIQVAEGEKYFMKSILGAVEELLSETKVKADELAAIGIGCPGILDVRKGIVLSSPNIRFLKNYPLAEKVRKAFGAEVRIGNDVNLGLYGEHQFGAAKGHSDVVGVFLGTGIGGALILNGKLYEGSGGAAGEIGHMVIDPLGPRCGCGRRGCLESLVGRLAIASEAAMLAAKQQAPHLYALAGSEVTKMKSGVLAKALKEGDKAIEDLLIRKSEVLGIALGSVVNLLNPELIVLGGGVIEAMEHYILPATKEAVQRYAMPGLAKQVKIVAAKLKDFSIVMGSAKYALDKIEEES